MHSNRPTYRTFWGISSFEILAWFRRGLFYSFLSIYLRHFLGLSVTETTLFATLPMIVNILFQTFVWGKVSDKYQLRRTLIIIGEISAGIGTVAIWYAHRLTDNLFLSGYIIIIGLTLIEVFWSMSNVSWSALISDLYRLEDRNRIQGRLASLGGVGRIAGVWSGGLLYDGFGLQFAGWGFFEGSLFFVAAGAMLISTIPMLFVPEGGIEKTNTTGVNRTGVDTRVSPTIFMVFLAAMAFINFGRNSIAIIQVQYLVLESGFAVSSKVVSYIVNSHSAAMVITGLISGWLGKRLGNGNALILGAAVSVAGLILLASADTLSLVYVSNLLRGVSEVIILASSYAYALKNPDEKFSQRCVELSEHLYYFDFVYPERKFADPNEFDCYLNTLVFNELIDRTIRGKSLLSGIENYIMQARGLFPQWSRKQLKINPD